MSYAAWSDSRLGRARNLPGAMKRQSIPVSLHHAIMALQVNSVPETIEPSLPRRSTIAVSSRATRRPEIASRHSLVTSSTMLRTRPRALLISLRIRQLS